MTLVWTTTATCASPAVSSGPHHPRRGVNISPTTTENELAAHPDITAVGGHRRAPTHAWRADRRGHHHAGSIPNSTTCAAGWSSTASRVVSGRSVCSRYGTCRGPQARSARTSFGDQVSGVP
ncbi:hypothetical protein HBB16_01515 [Pseudonocardia sp. MCCB 268]|nr:hypothetical protein [Pseudonocardia cytotoxica]